ncbi:flavin reductase family protein [Staphylococcus kloosii]|jgi:flavin reductase (DIM6/NTAB) family NADH-FMN oxidoreductase RutF|uniref:flavin reductase family protein n=1 Tax=Staphylococcus kloosii TaxID=29384 RepID=UPI00189EF79F|nr:flavin reductase family protein [Staphylococcus kloosii]MBF7024760.1 flavin reductase family protein [Staphylococcus kloosii]
MKQLNPQDLSKQQNYKLLSGSVIPRPIAFVTTQDSAGNINAAPFSFFNVVNSAPPMIMISTGRNNGKRKDTSLNIEETENFVVHITDSDNVEDVNITAAPIEREESEIERTQMELIDSTVVDAPSVNNAKVRMECKLDRLIQLGDELEGSDLIIGEVVMFHIDDQVYFEDSKINAETLQPIARLSGNDYARLGDKFTIERPTE